MTPEKPRKHNDELLSTYKPTPVLLIQESEAEKDKKNSNKSSQKVMKPIVNQKRKEAERKTDIQECDFSFRESLKSTAANSSALPRNASSKGGLSPKMSVNSQVSQPLSSKENIDIRKKLPKATPLALAKPQKALPALEEEYCPTFGNYKLIRFN